MSKRVMLVSIDTLRSDAIGLNPLRSSVSRFNTKTQTVTPTLNTLCEKGTFFPNCQAQAPYTTSSHASMLTGCWPHNHGIREYFFTPLHEKVDTLFNKFKQAGFVTILATDFPTLLGPILGFTEDVDHFIDEDDDALSDLLAELSGRNVFCFWHFADPHMPYGLSSLERDGHEFAEETRRVMQLAGIEATKPASEDWRLESNRTDEERVLRLGYYDAAERLYVSGQYDTLMDIYLRGVERFDNGRLATAIKAMRDIGWYDNALIAITGDHGEEHSARGYEHFDSIWNGVINVPLILIGPDIPIGRVDDHLVRSIDIAPTLLNLAGMEIDTEMDGISLRNRLKAKMPLGLVSLCEAWFGDYLKARDHLNACQAAGRLLNLPSMAERHLMSARDARWRYIVLRDLKAGTEDAYLFDLKADPNETNDVKDKFPHAASSLRRELEPMIAAQTQGSKRKGGTITKDIATGLIDMGYLRR
ncbi:MAG: sulfatase-like hydrolase/transferase [Rhodobacter sp.]|nr:sulfatase-like hydrolase/transferase [Rhodobacter sp.]